MPVDGAESIFAGKKYESTLMTSQLEKSPLWDSDKEQLPLSPKKAADLAIDYVEATLGHAYGWNDSPGWIVVKIELVQVIGTKSWYFRISVRPLMSGSNSLPFVRVFVTLDAKVSALARVK
jgi:hypothetical protein